MRLAAVIIFRIRYSLWEKFITGIRITRYRILGMHIGRSVSLAHIYASWPHQVSMGNSTTVEHEVFFKYDGPWRPGPSIIIGKECFIGNNCEFNINTRIEVADYCNIASGCKFIDHDHGIKAGLRIGPQDTVNAPIKIGEDAWLGVNVVILKGVTIGPGAVVAAGAVVNKNIPANEIWGGVPARRIGNRK